VKERLTGAIILVALMVLLIPELLTGPLRSSPRAAAVPSSAGEAPLRSYTIELADEARPRNATPQASGPRQPAPVAGTAQSDGAQADDVPPQTSGGSVAQDSAPEAASAPPSPGSASAGSSIPPPSRAASAPTPAARANSSTRPPAGRESAASAASAWLVQLGSFASRANAEHLAQQVRSQGFEVSVSQSSSGRHLFRVRVGGAKTQAGALALEQKLRALGHSGTVLPKQGGA
jgi:DedD protein